MFQRMLFIFLLLVLSSGHQHMVAAAQNDAAFISNASIYAAMNSGTAGGELPVANGIISGTVNDAATGHGLDGYRVFATQTKDVKVEAFDAQTKTRQRTTSVVLKYNQTAETISQADGTFRLADLPPGIYRVWVLAEESAYKDQYYPNADRESDAAPVLVTTDGHVDGIRFSLNEGSVLAGMVSLQNTGQGLGGITVHAYDVQSRKKVRSATTGPDGHYRIQGLSDGRYRIATEASALYPEGAYHADDPGRPATVDLEGTQTLDNLDIFLNRYGRLSGQVRSSDSDKMPLAGIRIMVYDQAGFPIAPRLIANAISDAGGNYIIPKIEAGSYIIAADPPKTYAKSWYGRAGLASQPTAVAIAEGQTLEGIDFTLTPGATISGTITSRTTTLPLDNVRLTLSASPSGEVIMQNSSNKNGEFILDRLPAGNYLLSVQQKGYQVSTTGKLQFQGSSAVISIGPGQTLTGIDFQLIADPTPGTGSINGQGRWAFDHSPINNLCVRAYAEAGRTLSGQGCSGLDGYYTINLLPDGEYLLCASAVQGGFLPECYDNIAYEEKALATLVTVTDGQAVDGIDFDLARLGSISGRLLRAGDMAEIGTFELSLPPGTYILQANAAHSGYSSTYYQGTTTPDEATVLIIGDGQSLENLQFILEVDPATVVTTGATTTP